MRAKKLYSILEKDFIKKGLTDDWANSMTVISDFLSDKFKKRSMGLVCDFAQEINHVYTAVFPSDKVMKKVIADDAKDAMLFIHHPSIWDIRKAPEVFQHMDRTLLQEFKKRRISIYNLHVPLDNFGEYSTSVTLAKHLGLRLEKPVCPYFGSLCGVFGRTDYATISDLKKRFEDEVGHKVSLYAYGDKKIKERRVAVIAGGGNSIEFLEEIANAGINTFITGITVKNPHSMKTHDFAKVHKINILGGTHYSTESFACIALVSYFKNLGLPAEFVADKPLLEDL